MPRLLVRLLIIPCLLVGATRSYAHVVHFGMAAPSGAFHWGSGRGGFLDRHVNFKSVAARGAMFVPCDDQSAENPVFPPFAVLP